MWYQVTPSLAEESDELTVLPTVDEENLTGIGPIVIASTGLKAMRIMPRTNVGMTVILNVKSHVK